MYRYVLRDHLDKPAREVLEHYLESGQLHLNSHIQVCHHWCDAMGNSITHYGPLSGKDYREYPNVVRFNRGFDIYWLDRIMVEVPGQPMRHVACDDPSLFGLDGWRVVNTKIAELGDGKIKHPYDVD